MFDLSAISPLFAKEQGKDQKPSIVGIGAHRALRENACISYMRKIKQFYNDDDHRQVKKTLGQSDFEVSTGHDVAAALNDVKNYRGVSPGSVARGKFREFPSLVLAGISESLRLRP